VSPSEALAPYDWSSAMGRWLLTELQTVEAHAAARRREKMAANLHEHHHFHHHGHHTSGRASAASNATTASSHGSGSLDSGNLDNSSNGAVIGGGSAPSSSFIPPSSSPATLLDVETFLLCVPTTSSTCYVVLTSTRVLYVRAKGLMWEPDVQWQGAMCDLELVSHISGETAVRFVAHPPLLKVAAAAPLSLLSLSSTTSGSVGGGGRKNGQPLFSFLRVNCEDVETAEKVKNVTQKAMKAALPRGGLLSLGG
jgi:hypothetical protein